MNRIHPLSFVAFAGIGLLAAAACAGGQPGTDESPLALDQGAIEDPADLQAHPPPRPPRCESSDECADLCPRGSQGCDCQPVGPNGEKICVPTCGSDADCPTPPDGIEIACRDGVCAPAGPPPGGPRPKQCDGDAACADACPPGAKGCACHQTPHGDKVCAPTCGTDADCPSGEGVPPLSCRENFCVPPGPPPR